MIRFAQTDNGQPHATGAGHESNNEFIHFDLVLNLTNARFFAQGTTDPQNIQLLSDKSVDSAGPMGLVIRYSDHGFIFCTARNLVQVAVLVKIVAKALIDKVRSCGQR